MAEYRVKIPVYQGPLDLLLFLIQKDEIDIFDIPIAEVTANYLAYLDLMEELNLNLAGDFFVMAATLMEIKSAMLLPRGEIKEGEEIEDPRAALVAQLLEYKRYKRIAEELSLLEDEQLRRVPAGGDVLAAAEAGGGESIFELVRAFREVLARAPEKSVFIPEEIGPSIEERVAYLRGALQTAAGRVRFEDIFDGPRIVMVVTFLALLELLRLGECRVHQERAFSTIWIYPTVTT